MKTLRNIPENYTFTFYLNTGETHKKLPVTI